MEEPFNRVKELERLAVLHRMGATDRNTFIENYDKTEQEKQTEEISKIRVLVQNMENNTPKHKEEARIGCTQVHSGVAHMMAIAGLGALAGIGD